ncbi:MAG: hypothetical protein JXR63_13305, partial [Spirochaetales bacterium]|nr:hypothetical protein [Spirochaetales bacterium]
MNKKNEIVFRFIYLLCSILISFIIFWGFQSKEPVFAAILLSLYLLLFSFFKRKIFIILLPFVYVSSFFISYFIIRVFLACRIGFSEVSIRYYYGSFDEL